MISYILKIPCSKKSALSSFENWLWLMCINIWQVPYNLAAPHAVLPLR